MGAVICMAGLGSAKALGEDLKTVPFVDLNRYQGRWYEIARYPNRFEKKCLRGTTATYTLKPNGKIEVLNECVTKNGRLSAARGEAKVVDKTTNSKLKVRFAPPFLSFLPFVWGNYWIVDIDPDYRYVAIGDPKRKYFWILSRTPQLESTTYESIIEHARQLGFDPGRIVKTRQDTVGQ